MAERKSVHLEKAHREAISDMDERDVADNQSEALRMCLDAGMRQYGYQNGQNGDTFLKMGINRLAWLSGAAGVAGLAFTLTYPVSARLPSFAVIVFSLLCFGLHRVLESYEPKITEGLLSLVGQGEKA